MSPHLNVNTAQPVNPDPIEILKQEHRDTLQRLEIIERTLQYLESLPGQTAEKRCKAEQVRLRDCISELSKRMERHFAMEEEALFPILAGYVGREHGPIEMMTQEHARIKSHFALWETRVNQLCKLTGLVREQVLKALATLGYQTIAELRLHISKEDQILFKICEVSLSKKEKVLVAQKIAMLGTQ